MKLSTRGRYGARAAFELAKHYGEGPIMVRQIAKRQEISERYLEQILNSLRTAELVKSTRGARGGYELARQPADITIGEVVRNLEGPFDIVPCTSESECGRIAECITCDIWAEVKTAIENVLDNITLADLVEKDRLRKEPGRIDYAI